jgi:hypothetical protein
MRNCSNPRMAPSVRTIPPTTLATPQSRLLLANDLFLTRVPTGLREIPVTLLVNQAWLNNWVTGLGDSIVTAEYGVPFQDVTGAQNIVCSPDAYETAKSTAAAVAVREIVRPTARGSQRNRWCLSCRTIARTSSISSTWTGVPRTSCGRLRTASSTSAASRSP